MSLRASVAARLSCASAYVQPRFRLGDLGRQRGDLLGAHAGIDVVAVGSRGIERSPRLRHRSGQFDRRQLGYDITGADGVALVDLDRRELAADLGRDADLGRADDAGDRRSRRGAQQEISAGARSDQDDTKHEESGG